MTDTSAEAIAALLDGVTPGPWEWWGNSGLYGPANSAVIWPEDGYFYSEYTQDSATVHVSKADARFLAAARELVPALAAERAALAEELVSVLQREAATTKRYDDRLDAAETALAAEKAKVARMRDFLADFAEAKIEALPMPHVRHPADEPDPVVDAETVWAWQEDALAALKGGE